MCIPGIVRSWYGMCPGSCGDEGIRTKKIKIQYEIGRQSVGCVRIQEWQPSNPQHPRVVVKDALKWDSPVAAAEAFFRAPDEQYPSGDDRAAGLIKPSDSDGAFKSVAKIKRRR